MNKFIKTIALAALLALPVTATNAQTESPAGKTHRIVFEVTMEGPEQWTAVLNNVENLARTARHSNQSASRCFSSTAV